MNSALLHAKRSILAVAFTVFALSIFVSDAFAQEALLATAEMTAPNTTIAPEQSIDLTTSDVNPPLPVASTDPATESIPVTNVDSGIPRRFHYQFRLAVRTVYDDNINGALLFHGGSIDLKANTLTVDSQNDLNGADNVNWQGTIQINENVAGTGGSIVKDGSSTLILQGVSNTYTGGTTIKGGILGIYDDGSLGTAPASPTDNIFFAASSASNPTTTRTLQDNTNNVTLSANRGINIAPGVTGTFDNNGNAFTINGIVSGGGAAATKGNGGSVTFTNANTYTGGTTIQSGTFFVNNASGSGTGSGAVVVNSSGTLGGNGTIDAGSNTVTVNGIVAPGSAANTVGALTLKTSSTILGSGSTFLVDLSGAVTDQLLTNGTFDLTALNNTIQFNSLATLTQSSYTLATYSGAALGIFENVVNLPANYNLVYNVGELDLVMTPVPEPSTWIGAALALGAIGVMGRKRFKKKS